jgi:rubrerythrin
MGPEVKNTTQDEKPDKIQVNVITSGEVYVCGMCDRELGYGPELPKNCPHCNAYFKYVQL